MYCYVLLKTIYCGYVVGLLTICCEKRLLHIATILITGIPNDMPLSVHIITESRIEGNHFVLGMVANLT